MNKEVNIFAIITAAGLGTRFNKSKSKVLPKQFLKLNGVPVIIHSLLKFEKCKFIKGIVISSDKKYFRLIENLAKKYKIRKLIKITEGGKTRFQSVKNAFYCINCSKKDIILIHDAARPNLTSKDLNNLIKEAIKYGEAILVTAITETIKYIKNYFIIKTISRENLYAAQTPQAFRYSVLLRSYEKADKNSIYTDEASLAESAGYKIRTVLGSKYNIKITSKEDFNLLKNLI